MTPDTVGYSFVYFILSSQQLWKADFIMIFILHMKELRPREVKGRPYAKTIHL